MKMKIIVFVCVISCVVQASQVAHQPVEQKIADTLKRINVLQARCSGLVQQMNGATIESANQVTVESLLRRGNVSSLQKNGIELRYQTVKLKFLQRGFAETELASARKHVHEIYRIHDQLDMLNSINSASSAYSDDDSALISALEQRKAEAYLCAYPALSKQK